ncbi:MAG: hypothetical protein GAK37_00306 [Pseudomonas sp.]|nr:MAG: hypothetical protein GAK37_00306 [Pseudomonas sp.]
MHLRIDAINPFSYCSHIAAIREPLFNNQPQQSVDRERL